MISHLCDTGNSKSKKAYFLGNSDRISCNSVTKELSEKIERVSAHFLVFDSAC
jgi:hypothetical protein